MQSTLTAQEADPHDIFVIEPDVVLATRADHAASDAAPVIPPVSAPHIVVAPDAAAASVPPVDTTFRAAANDDNRLRGAPPSRGGWMSRVTVAFLFALCSAVVAAAWQHYGDRATQMIATWAPSFALISSSPPATSGAAGQPNSPAVQAAAADQAPPSAAASAEPAQNAAPSGAAPAAAAAAPDATPSVQSMAQDIAAMGQQIEGLKATIEQLKAGQEQMAQQMSRELARKPQARLAEQNPRPKLSALPPRPATLPARRPPPQAFSPGMAAAAIRTSPPAAAPTYAPPQAAAPVPYNSRPQMIDRTDGDPLDRPPLPVR